MSRSIDERVVEMRFDNQQFERGVKESLGTLDKLKAALKLEDSAKSFEKLDKAANSVSLEGISAGVEALQRRFSTLGIVGMRVLENITDTLMNMANRTMSYVTDAVISGGLKRAQNIENAHFQLQALLKDEEKVQAVMDDAMASVDGTAYAYDEAAKAASQFAASGLQAGEEMERALKAVTGVAAMTNSDYESIARIFTTVAGNGRLMGDQLLQLGARGMNAAATIADYFREVQGQANITEGVVREMVSDAEISFEIFAEAMSWAFGESAFRANETFTGAMANMRSALARIGAGFFSPLIEQNSDLILLINTVRERINDIKKSLVFDEQTSAISGLAKATSVETEALTTFFDEIDKNGSVTTHHLNELSSVGVDAADSLTTYINGVTDGSIRASYATKTALSELTGDLEVNKDQVVKFVEDGKINLAIFTSAMETAFGDERKISKQFTDSVLNVAKSVSEYLKSLDLSKPMDAFNYGIEAIKNLAKGLYSVLKPIGQAFGDTFLVFKGNDLVNFAAKIERFTAKLKLSEKGAKNLHDTFQGLFGITKLLIDGFLGLIGVVLPATEPIGSLTDLVLALTGAMGRGLTSITGWIRESPLLNRAYLMLAAGVQDAMAAIAGFISSLDELGDYIYNLPFTQKAIQVVIGAFYMLYTKSDEYLTFLEKKIKKFGEIISDLFPKKAQISFDDLVVAIGKINKGMEELDSSKAVGAIGKFTSVIKRLIDVLKRNEGIAEFISNMKLYFEDFAKSVDSSDGPIGVLEKFMDIVQGFVNWFIKTTRPLFEGFTFEGAAATTGGLAIIYAIVKVSKSMENVSNSISKTAMVLPKMFSSIQSALSEYQKNLKADTLMKIAKAIAILAVSLTILSFADTERVYEAAIALGAIGAALVLATGYFVDAAKKAPTIETVLNNLTKGLTKSLNNLAKAVKWKAIGSAIKDLGITIGIIAASIAGLAYLYSKDSENMNKALSLIGVIATVMAGFMLMMSGLGEVLDHGMTEFAKAGFAVLALAASMGIVISALKSLFKLEIPEDWKTKILLLSGIFAELGALVVVIGVASRIGGQNSIKAGPILALAASLYVSVLALKSLFNIELPRDYKQKFMILGGLFGAFIVTVLAIGVASRISKEGMKGTATILAMCGFIATAVLALGVLSIFPAKKLLTGAIAIGTVLITLGLALLGASQISDKNTYKTVTSMALQVGAITAALGFLSLLPAEKLLKGAVALGSVMLILATNLYAASKITDKFSFLSILAMSANIIVIAVSLAALASQPWEKLLAGAASLSGVLLSVAAAFKIISSSKVDANAIGAFMFGSIGVIITALALGLLAEQPWEQMLAAAGSLSALLLSIGGCFALFSAVKPDVTTFGSFFVGILGLWAIGQILTEVSSQPWGQLLGTATALSELILALSAALVLVSISGELSAGAVAGMVAFAIFIAEMYGIIRLLGELSEEAEAFLVRGGEILVELGTYIGQYFGALIANTLEGVSNALPGIGQNLSDFAENSKGFFEILGGLDDDVLKGAVNLAGTIIAITAAEVINGISSFLLGGKNLKDFGKELKGFGKAIADFAEEVKGINGDDVETASNCALALASLYKNLPREDGWLDEIFGKKTSLEDFGTQLVEFGKAMVNYSSVVNGKIDQGAVEASISAAEIIFAFADKLPKEDGWVQRILGEQKTLAEFASELLPFGYNMVIYSSVVKDKIDQGAVEASISAAEIIFAFADKLPDMGGLVDAIFGHQKTLSEFAEELVPFANKMVIYSQVVSGLRVDAVKKSKEAAMALVDIGNALSNSGGLVEIFTGSSGLDKFGVQLAIFGTGLSTYAHLVEKIDTEQLDKVIVEVRKLIELANELKPINPTLMTNFSRALATMGSFGIAAFINAFGDGYKDAKKEIESFAKNVTEVTKFSFKNTIENMKTIGKNIVDGLLKGIEDNKGAVEFSMLGVSKSIERVIRDHMVIQSPSKLMEYIGRMIDAGLGKGISADAPEVIEAAEDMAAQIGEAISGFFYEGRTGKDALDSLNRMFTVITAAEKHYDELTEQYNKKKEKLKEKQKKKQKKDIEEQEELYTDSLESESKYWEMLFKLRKGSFEKAEEQEEAFLEYQKNVLKETTENLKTYAEKLQSTRDSIMGSDLFSEVSKKTSKSKAEIKKNLEDQIKEIEAYSDVLAKLSDRLAGRELLDYIQTLGVDSVEQLKVMNSMTDEELGHYADLYDKKMESATQAATIQLQSLQTETEAKLSELFGFMQTSVDLFDFSAVFDGSLQSINNYVASLSEPFEQSKEYLIEATAGIPDAIAEGVEKGVSTNLKPKVKESIESGVGEAVKEGSETVATEGIKLGEYITKGITSGIESPESMGAAKKVAENVTKGILDAFQSKAEISSPSELMRREVGVYLTEGIAEGILDGQDSVIKAITELMKIVVESLSDSDLGGEGSVIGQVLVTGMIEGIELQRPLLVTNSVELCQELIGEYEKTLSSMEFKPIGENIITYIIDGIESIKPVIKAISMNLCYEVIQVFRDNFTREALFEIGAYAAEGLADGIESKIKEIKDAAVKAAKKAIESAKKALGEKSPSKVFFEIGEYVSIGMANGISSQISTVGDVTEEAANTSIDSMNRLIQNISKSLENSEDFQPTICPILDMSNIEQGFNEIEKMFNDRLKMSLYDGMLQASDSFTTKQRRIKEVSEETKSEQKGNTYYFEQKNYSPKTLSRVEIYRQTKNLFSTWKGAVEQ